MNSFVEYIEPLQSLCDDARASHGLNTINIGLNRIFGNLDFRYAMTRGDWYRLGGVVDGQHQPVAESLSEWLKPWMGKELDDFFMEYLDSGYFVTIHSGRTHYFTARTGDLGQEYIQVEIEQIQEVIERPLIDPDWVPDSFEELIDPVDYPRLPAETVGDTRFVFRRISPINLLIDEFRSQGRSSQHMPRFFDDWNRSSAGDTTHFSQHWVLSLREYMDADKQILRSAKPVPTRSRLNLELPSGERYSGVRLAHEIHSYDRKMGYPFSWFFMMITRKSENIRLADAVLDDLMGAYDYLPAKDLKVLRDWVLDPYGV